MLSKSNAKFLITDELIFSSLLLMRKNRLPIKTTALKQKKIKAGKSERTLIFLA